MTLVGLLIFSGALIADSVTPGPTVAAVIARVLARGSRDVLPFLIAIWLGEGIWLSLAVAGLAALAASVEWLFLIVKWFGVAYLCYLAWRIFYSNIEIQAENLPERDSKLSLFITGLSVSIGNPKNMIFYLTLVPSLVDMQNITVTGWSQLVLTLIATLIVVDTGWVLIASKARSFLRESRAIRRINQFSGALMAAAAVAIAVR
ncbi:lysine transporter LysE [Ensifer sp. Root31]|uniref:LysE family translocator n=1 Tax=Ensifer sp. Root31 TaxID=1736512 RepID=UPI00070A1AE5|nr:LysE family translocator [Ensifer sp. Root31]KQU86439.1 lysine transporter LysE [Ensifer sp. Root31]